MKIYTMGFTCVCILSKWIFFKFTTLLIIDAKKKKNQSIFSIHFDSQLDPVWCNVYIYIQSAAAAAFSVTRLNISLL